MSELKSFGKKGEDFATKALLKKGFSIIARNYYSPYGEIDIIAQKEDIIAFIEVKTRSSISFGLPCEAVGITKRRRMLKTALIFLSENEMDLQPRFDIFEIIVTKKTDTKTIKFRHIESAFEANDSISV